MCKVEGALETKLPEAGKCMQQGGWKLDLGVHFLPTMDERSRRESPGSWGVGCLHLEHH